MINMQNKIRNIKGKLEILQFMSSAVVLVLVFVAVVNSHQLFPHTQVYVGIGLVADRSGIVGCQGQSPGFAFRVEVVVGLGTSVAGGCVQLTKLCKLVIL